MIITKLTGGLGNQMYQYAAGRRAVYKNNTELKLDISWYENPGGATKREYLLHIFRIKENFSAPNEIQRLTYFKQKYFHFDPKVLKVSDDTYLDGSWQSEKYFEDIKGIIKQEFIFKKEPDSENREKINEMINSNSVSIHIRRGDYVYDKKNNEFHGVCSADYYHKAVCLIVKKINKAKFFIFSDDPEWVKNNFRLNYPFTIVSHNFSKRDYEDLRLMSLCHHNIIANSTFSWWGAWLNQNPDKIIIAPKEWFRSRELNAKDVIPKPWIKISYQL